MSGDSEREKGIVAAAARSPKGAEMIKLVARHGADLISTLTPWGQTALHYAVHEETALFLINKGADVHAVTTGGEHDVATTRAALEEPAQQAVRTGARLAPRRAVAHAARRARLTETK